MKQTIIFSSFLIFGTLNSNLVMGQDFSALGMPAITASDGAEGKHNVFAFSSNSFVDDSAHSASVSCPGNDCVYKDYYRFIYSETGLRNPANTSKPSFDRCRSFLEFFHYGTCL